MVFLGRAIKPHCASPPNVISIMKLLILLFLIGAEITFAQVDKIKIKKESRADSSSYLIKIQNGLYAKKMILHSLDMSDTYEKDLVNTIEFRKVTKFIDQTIEIKNLTLKVIFDQASVIDNYYLKSIDVKKHISKNKDYQNHIDVELIYEKKK